MDPSPRGEPEGSDAEEDTRPHRTGPSDVTLGRSCRSGAANLWNASYQTGPWRVLARRQARYTRGRTGRAWAVDLCMSLSAVATEVVLEQHLPVDRLIRGNKEIGKTSGLLDAAACIYSYGWESRNTRHTTKHGTPRTGASFSLAGKPPAALHVLTGRDDEYLQAARLANKARKKRKSFA